MSVVREITGLRVPAIERVHRSRFVNVDGITTHYLEAGEGPVLVLLHSGEFGGAAEISWEYLIPLLAPHFHIFAPDWLGFGRTDKVHDFESKSRRMLSHLVRFCEVMAIERAHFAGNSMGGTYLLKLAAETPCRIPIDKLVAIAGGGFVPDNKHRQSLLNYDGTEAGMVEILKAIFTDPRWWEDGAYVARRHAMSLMPGAWESVAAARFRSPFTKARSEFGQKDVTPYEAIKAPTLLVVGGKDKLRLPGYTDDMAARIPTVEVAYLPESGHSPNLEDAPKIASLMLEFLADTRSCARE